MRQCLVVQSAGIGRTVPDPTWQPHRHAALRARSVSVGSDASYPIRAMIWFNCRWSGVLPLRRRLLLGACPAFRHGEVYAETTLQIGTSCKPCFDGLDTTEFATIQMFSQSALDLRSVDGRKAGKTCLPVVRGLHHQAHTHRPERPENDRVR